MFHPPPPCCFTPPGKLMHLSKIPSKIQDFNLGGDCSPAPGFSEMVALFLSPPPISFKASLTALCTFFMFSSHMLRHTLLILLGMEGPHKAEQGVLPSAEETGFLSSNHNPKHDTKGITGDLYTQVSGIPRGKGGRAEVNSPAWLQDEGGN